MCDLCGGTKWFSGRVEYIRWRNLEDSPTVRTNGGKVECWEEGNALWCPHCAPDAYGKVTKVTKR